MYCNNMFDVNWMTLWKLCHGHSYLYKCSTKPNLKSNGVSWHKVWLHILTRIFSSILLILQDEQIIFKYKVFVGIFFCVLTFFLLVETFPFNKHFGIVTYSAKHLIFPVCTNLWRPPDVYIGIMFQSRAGNLRWTDNWQSRGKLSKVSLFCPQ